MLTGKVVGNVWCTVKHPSLDGAKLLLVRYLDLDSNILSGETFMAVDLSMDAGPGDKVLVMDEGNSARQILGRKNCPVSTVICGVLDEAKIKGVKHKYL